MSWSWAIKTMQVETRLGMVKKCLGHDLTYEVNGIFNAGLDRSQLWQRESSRRSMGSRVKALEKNRKVVDVCINEALKSTVSHAAAVQTIMDFGATSGRALLRNLAIRKPSQYLRVWCLDIEDVRDNLSGTGTEVAGCVRVARLQGEDGTKPTVVQVCRESG